MRCGTSFMVKLGRGMSPREGRDVLCAKLEFVTGRHMIVMAL